MVVVVAVAIVAMVVVVVAVGAVAVAVETGPETVQLRLIWNPLCSLLLFTSPVTGLQAYTIMPNQTFLWYIF